MNAADWSTVASLATALGTLILAVATFSAVRSANMMARVAQQQLLVGLRPVLMASRRDDATMKVNFGDRKWVQIPGGGAGFREYRGGDRGQVRTRRGRRSRRQRGLRDDGEGAPADDGGRTRWYSRSPRRAALVAALALGTAVTVPPANGAVGGIAAGFVRAMRHLSSPGLNGRAFAGTPAVGALFTTSAGKPRRHFCSASVVDSPYGDLVITAAHCVTSRSGTVSFVPGYDNGAAPYGVWTVTRIYVDRAWSSSANPDDDVAFLRVSRSLPGVRIEDVTGAEQLGMGTPSARERVEVIGYPNSASQPITCQNRLREPFPHQLEFDCGGYTGGTSGGPFLARVSRRTGQGTVIGVIGGYEQGGTTPQVSYSAVFRANVAALYRTAVAGG